MPQGAFVMSTVGNSWSMLKSVDAYIFIWICEFCNRVPARAGVGIVCLVVISGWVFLWEKN